MPIRGTLCLLLVCLPACYCGLADLNSWPFSNFPMYSAPMRLGAYRQYNAYMVTEDGRPLELRNRESLWPLNVQRLQVRAKSWAAMPNGRQNMEDLLRYYSKRAVNRYRKDGKPGDFPARLQIRHCMGHYQVVNGELLSVIDEYEIAAEVTSLR